MADPEFGTYENFVDGESWSSATTFEVEDPSTEETVAEVSSATGADVEAAIEAATRAAPNWAAYDPVERSRLLNRVARRLDEHVETLARLETREMGRSLGASEAQAEKTARYFEYYAGIADKIQGDTIPIDGDRELLDYTLREPYGTTAHIVPWNASMVLAVRSITPALAAGNTVVAKADENAPLSFLKLAELADEAGIPPGVLNVVTGGGAATGELLVDDDRVNHVEFTGSTASGTEVMKTAAEHITPVHLELGGKSPNLVFPDADLERAARDSVKAFWNAGQTCFAPTRIFVHGDVYEKFTDRLVERTEGLSVGPGIEGNTVGPLISRSALDRVERYVETAVENGGRVLTGGSRLDRPGNFFEPTLIDSVDDDAPISCEEVFGPVLTVYEFGSEAEAIRRANDTDYGLYALVWTQDIVRGHRLAGQLEAGTVLLNKYLFASQQAPSGGYKKSGIGRAKGKQALKNYTQLKNVVVSLEEE